MDVVIKYKDPHGDIGSWAITGTEDEENGIVYKDFGIGETLTISGRWTFWGHVTFVDGRTAPGEAATQYIDDEGS